MLVKNLAIMNQNIGWTGIFQLLYDGYEAQQIVNIGTIVHASKQFYFLF